MYAKLSRRVADREQQASYYDESTDDDEFINDDESIDHLLACGNRFRRHNDGGHFARAHQRLVKYQQVQGDAEVARRDYEEFRESLEQAEAAPWIAKEGAALLQMSRTIAPLGSITGDNYQGHLDQGPESWTRSNSWDFCVLESQLKDLRAHYGRDLWSLQQRTSASTATAAREGRGWAAAEREALGALA
eukprot:scaffold31635_cov21-Phaeocystis_antarctica.AAC.1